MSKNSNKSNKNWKAKFSLFIRRLPAFIALLTIAFFNKSASATSRTPPGRHLLPQVSHPVDSRDLDIHRQLVPSTTLRQQISKLNKVPFEKKEPNYEKRFFQQIQRQQIVPTAKMATLKKGSFSGDDNQVPKNEFERIEQVFSNRNRSFFVRQLQEALLENHNFIKDLTLNQKRNSSLVSLMVDENMKNNITLVPIVGKWGSLAVNDIKYEQSQKILGKELSQLNKIFALFKRNNQDFSFLASSEPFWEFLFNRAPISKWRESNDFILKMV